MGPREKLIAFKGIVIKEVLRFSRIWIQTVLPPMITTSLYFVIFGNLMGSRIGPMHGIAYEKFIMPGLVMLAVITNSYANVVSSFYGAKFQRHIEEMLVAPVPNYIILLGFVAGGVARGLIVGIAVTIVSLLFVDVSIFSFTLTAIVVFLTAVLFSLAGFINGAYARSFDDISIVPTFVLTPLTYLGGIFYSIGLLPQFWQDVSLGNPILFMINAFRYGMLGVSDIDVRLALFIICAFVAALFAYSLSLLRRGVGIRS